MKKTLAILLCLVMLLASVACSKAPNEPSNEPNNETNTQGNSTANTGNATAVPTEEEKTQIEKYQTAVRALNGYVKEGVLVNYKLGEEYLDKTESLGYYYKDILAAECVEKWVGTEYASDDTINWNRQEVLDNFVVIEDVLLKIKVQFEDNLGNTEPHEAHYVYGVDGNLREIRRTDGGAYPFFGWSIEHQEANFRVVNYIYEGNRLVKMQCSQDGNQIVKTITPTYNEDGLKVKDLIQKTKTQAEYTYTYDSNGRLITVTKDSMTIKLSYDEKGYLTEYLRIYGTNTDLRIQYTYNDDHSMCTAERYSGKTLTGTSTYTLDKAGRLLTVEDLVFDSFRVKENYELIYGNYYIYKPAMEDKD